MKSLCLVLLLLPSLAFSQSPRTLVAKGDAWHWAFADEAPSGWREPGFDDSAWRTGPSGFGYGDDDDATVLADMKGRHAALAIRRSFDASARDAEAALSLVVRSDDGFVAWLNGREIARARVSGDPPAPDALATDHEATRAETFAIPAGVVKAGTNVLCVQAHNSDLSSSDFTIEPQIVVATPASPAGHSARRSTVTTSTTIAAYDVSNYFQGRAGTPKESVLGEVVRQEVRVAPAGKPGRLSLRAEINRVGDLGTSGAAAVRGDWRFGRHEAWVSLDTIVDRPAFRLAGALATGDETGLQAGWLVKLGKGAAFSLWADAARENLELDDRRDNDDVLEGVSVRFLRDHDAFSPEIGIEHDERSAGDPAFEFEQRRVFLRLRGKPSGAVTLSGLLRYGLRDYATAREDRRRLVRLTCDVRLSRRVDLVTFASWEDGQSSLEAQPFESTTAWAGIRVKE